MIAWISMSGLIAVPLFLELAISIEKQWKMLILIIGLLTVVQERTDPSSQGVFIPG